MPSQGSSASLRVQVGQMYSAVADNFQFRVEAGHDRIFSRQIILKPKQTFVYLFIFFEKSSKRSNLY